MGRNQHGQSGPQPTPARGGWHQGNAFAGVFRVRSKRSAEGQGGTRPQPRRKAPATRPPQTARPQLPPRPPSNAASTGPGSAGARPTPVGQPLPPNPRHRRPATGDRNRQQAQGQHRDKGGTSGAGYRQPSPHPKVAAMHGRPAAGPGAGMPAKARACTSMNAPPAVKQSLTAAPSSTQRHHGNPPFPGAFLRQITSSGKEEEREGKTRKRRKEYLYFI